MQAKAVKGIAKKLPPGKKQSALYSLIQESIKLDKKEEKQYQKLIQANPVYKEAKMLESMKDVGREEGREEGVLIGREEGVLIGVLIGEILMVQRILKQNVYSQEELEDKSLDELNNILAEFEGKLN